MENATLQNNPLLLQLAMLYAIEYWQLVAKIQTAAAGAIVFLNRIPSDLKDWQPVLEWHEKLDAQLLSLEIGLDEVCVAHGIDPAMMRKIAGTTFYENLRPNLTPDADFLAVICAAFSAHLDEAAIWTNGQFVNAAELNFLRTTSHDIHEIMSENGKAGAATRHAPMKILRKWTIEQYQAGNWPSANAASHDLKEKVLAHGRTIGAHLSKQNAQRTIAEWFRKSD